MKTITQAEPRLRKVIISCLLALQVSGLSQTVLSVPSTRTPPSVARPGLGGPPPPSYSELSSAFSALAPLAKWGSVNIRPNVSYQILYGDGILRVPGEPTNTTQQSLSIGMLFDLGKYWALNYSGSRTWYSTRLIADYTSHEASLSGRISKGDWTFGIFQSYSSRAATLVETGQQTPETSYSTGGSASYQIGNRTLLDLSFNRSTRESDLPLDTPGGPVPDVEQWSGTASLHYRFSPRLDLSLGFKMGYDSVSNSDNMDTSEPQFTLTWRPTDKLTLTGRGGLETRKFQGGNTKNLDSEVYSASVSYQPTPYTTISVSGDRSVSPSYFANQLSRTTGWGVNFQQRLLQRYFVGAGIAHGRTTYLVSERGFIIGRDDRFDSVNTSLSTTISKRGSISLTYQRSKNSSTIDNYGFSSNQYGMNLAYRF